MLFDGATPLGIMARKNVSASTNYEVNGFHVLTPTSGTHTYSARAYLAAAATVSFSPGSGGSGNDVPMFLHVMPA